MIICLNFLSGDIIIIKTEEKASRWLWFGRSDPCRSWTWAGTDQPWLGGPGSSLMLNLSVSIWAYKNMNENISLKRSQAKKVLSIAMCVFMKHIQCVLICLNLACSTVDYNHKLNLYLWVKYPLYQNTAEFKGHIQPHTSPRLLYLILTLC